MKMKRYAVYVRYSAFDTRLQWHDVIEAKTMRDAKSKTKRSLGACVHSYTVRELKGAETGAAYL